MTNELSEIEFAIEGIAEILREHNLHATDCRTQPDNHANCASNVPCTCVLSLIPRNDLKDSAPHVAKVVPGE